MSLAAPSLEPNQLPTMSLQMADQRILQSRHKLLAISAGRGENLSAFVLREILELESLALAVPSKGLKIHRLLFRWRQLYASLWDAAA